MIIEFRVAEKEGKKYFYEEDSELYFNMLSALDIFERGRLKIFRKKEKIAECSIGWYGTHGACNCFISNVGFREYFNHYATSALTAKEFQLGDHLFLEIPKDEFWFELEIKRSFVFHRGMDYVPTGKTMKWDTLLRSINGAARKVIETTDMDNLKILDFERRK